MISQNFGNQRVMSKKESKLFRRVDKPTDRKFKFEGYCPCCKKTRFFRWTGGSISETYYTCMSCKTEVREHDEYETSKK